MTKTKALKQITYLLNLVIKTKSQSDKTAIVDNIGTLLESALSDDGWVKGNEPKESGWYFVFLNEEIYYDYYNKGGIWAKFDLPSSPEIIKQISHYKRMKTNPPKSK